MAILYRCDVNRMGGGLNTVSLVKRRLLSKTYNAELLYGGEVIPCVATFYPGNSYKIVYIKDHEKEREVCGKFMDSLRDNPRLMFEYLARDLIKIAAVLGMFIFLFLMALFALAVLSGKDGLAPLQFYFFLTGFLGSCLIKYLLNLV